MRKIQRHKHKRCPEPLEKAFTAKIGLVRHVVARRVYQGIEYTLHATKGYRAQKMT